MPFLACNVVTIPGRFGDGGDTLWLFEEGVPEGDGSCPRRPEHQRYVGIGTADSVAVMSGRLAGIDESGESPIWPNATPDLNGDGLDEIALAFELHGDNEGVHLWFLAYDGRGVGHLSEPDGLPFQGQIGRFIQGNLEESTMGVYCGRMPAPPGEAETPPSAEGVVHWQSSSDDVRTVFAQLWRLRGTSGSLSLEGEQELTVGDVPRDYPPGGSVGRLCGSAVHMADEFEFAPSGQGG